MDSRLTLDNSSHTFDQINQAHLFLAEYPKGKVVPLYVSNCGAVVLLNDIDWPRRSHYLAIGLAGLLILVFGLMLGLIL